MLQLTMEEQLLDCWYWKELKSAGTKVAGLQDSCYNLEKAKADAEAEFARVIDDASRMVREAEEKAKTVVASETARLQAEFDRRLEEHLSKERQEVVMAYRRDRARAVGVSRCLH